MSVSDDLQVIKLTGDVKIKINIKEADRRDDYTAKAIREECAKYFRPIRVVKIIQ